MSPARSPIADRLPGFLRGDGAMAAEIAAFDWTSTPLGPIDDWPSELSTAAAIMLQSDYPTAIWWGGQRLLIHNDAYCEILGDRSPALARGFSDVWPETGPALIPEFDRVTASAVGISQTSARVDIERGGKLAEAYWNYSLTPIVDRAGHVLGVLNGVREVTDAVFRQRLDTLIVDLDDRLFAATSPEVIVQEALATIGKHLKAKRTGFGEVDSDAQVLAIGRCWSAGEMPDIAGRYPLGTFGAISGPLARGESVIIADNRTDPRTNDPAVLAAYDRIGLRAGIVVPILDRGRYAGGVFVQDDCPREWTRHEVALAEAASRRLWQALARTRAEIALRQSEQRYRVIFQQADDIIFTANLDQRITDCNAAGAAAMGIPRETIIGRSIADFLSRDDFQAMRAMLDRKRNRRGSMRHEIDVVGGDGRRMRWENNLTLVVDRDDKAIGLLSISRDVTERRAFEQRRELLINELNHRVKNTLALVQGIAHQSFRADADPDVALEKFLARLGTLAGAHDLLTREHWEGITFAELIRVGTASLEPGRIAAGGSATALTPKAAVGLAMALHELRTNAVKYGALSVEAGRIDLAWTLTNDRLVVEWRERGGPPVTVPTRRGFGVKMIERALASDLRATVSVDFAPAGVRCRIDAPREGNVI